MVRGDGLGAGGEGARVRGRPVLREIGRCTIIDGWYRGDANAHDDKVYFEMQSSYLWFGDLHLGLAIEKE